MRPLLTEPQETRTVRATTVQAGMRDPREPVVGGKQCTAFRQMR
jgi:hypothetical protein